ncbi:MAG TPA: hypothetical protein VNW04_13845, partial [Puia sp.]|nr:hypothetical protein [Puia sp.]
MKNKTKHLLSFAVLVSFTLLAASSRVNRLPGNTFNQNQRVEQPSENCLVKVDGTRIYGHKISWNTGLLAKRTIEIDGQRYPRSEIKGYYLNNAYFGRVDKDYGKRIVHGKINVYVERVLVTDSHSNSGGMTTTSTYWEDLFYAQMGEDGLMTHLANKRDIKKILAACPLSLEIMDKWTRKERNNPSSM